MKKNRNCKWQDYFQAFYNEFITLPKEIVVQNGISKLFPLHDGRKVIHAVSNQIEEMFGSLCDMTIFLDVK